MWTWAEEWKEKLNQALLDWNKLREEETVLLSWLSSKEQTMDVIGQTDVTDEEQVKMHLNLLEVNYCFILKILLIQSSYGSKHLILEKKNW